MEYRRLGASGLEVSRLCLGTMMFGAWGRTGEKESARIIHRALEAGINFVDTANVYSAGESEEIVGRALAGRLDEVVLATKVGLKMGDGRYESGLARKAIQQQAAASLARLGVEAVDLYQIHRPDPATPWEETLSTLDLLVRQGRVRHLGCSTNHYDVKGQKRLTAWEIADTLALAERRGWERWVSLQPPYSMLRRTMELEHFPMTRRHGMGNIVWSPLEGGWLTGKYRKGRSNPEDSPRAKRWVGDLGDPKFERRLEVVEELVALAGDKGVPLAELALAWVLRNPDVTSAIIGPRTEAQLESCLHALEIEISDDEAARIDELVPPGQSVL